MEVHLSPDQQDRVQQIAARVGKNAEQVVQDAVERMIAYEATFLTAVEEGRASARKGDLLEHEDVVERIEKLLRS